MIYLVMVLAAVSTALLVVAAITADRSREERVVDRRLATLRSGSPGMRRLEERRLRQARRQRLQELLETIGERVSSEDERASRTRRRLEHAGIRHPMAVAWYVAARVLLAAGLAGLVLLGGGFLSLPFGRLVLLATAAAVLGWVLPHLYVWSRTRRRQRELQRALPDALDLLVVCVEAGLGLNQALARVATEMDRLSPPMGDELTVLNLEIRAGTPRESALRNLARRTGLPSVRSLVGMLIQTERFGTSIARALRVQSESLRTKRRQRAEEQAAKTSIKMLFPLVFFIFPAMFVIILGPAAFHLTGLFGTQ